MTYYALISPQGHTEYNAEVLMGNAVHQLEHGKIYSNEQLAEIKGSPLFTLRDSPGAIEKNIKKWRFEIQ